MGKRISGYSKGVPEIAKRIKATVAEGNIANTKQEITALLEEEDHHTVINGFVRARVESDAGTYHIYRELAKSIPELKASGMVQRWVL